MWIMVTSALTGAVIVTIMIMFLCCIILLKRLIGQYTTYIVSFMK